MKKEMEVEMEMSAPAPGHPPPAPPPRADQRPCNGILHLATRTSMASWDRFPLAYDARTALNSSFRGVLCAH